MKNKKLLLIPVVFLLMAAVVFLLTQKTDNSQAISPDSESLNTQMKSVKNENTEISSEVPAQDEQVEVKEEPASDTQDTNAQEQPFLVQITDSDPSIADVLVRMPNPIGLLPLPTEGEYTRTIRQTMADGSEAINVLHLTPNGFWMEDANCEGQDCVNEGEVTLENREERILWNMVICLPHQLSLELITREEAESLLR